MENRRKIVLVVILIVISTAISLIFWHQEIQYSLPTPIPENHQEVAIGAEVQLSAIVKDNRPKLLHFYNPSCPCSRFNSAHVKELYARYGSEMSFWVVTEKENYQARKEFGFPVLEDPYGVLADACGVYSTPQALVLDKENKIYYRGNYNKERFCTNKKDNFAEIAILDLLEGKGQRKEFSELATRSYGCQLSSDLKK